jgi:hypothetical protein
MNRFFLISYLLVLIILCGCTHRTTVNDSKSRIERVKGLSYRDLSVPNNLVEQLLDYGKIIWKSISPSEEKVFLIKGKENSIIQIFERLDESLEKIRNDSYELWRDKDFEFTALVYRSSSVNSETHEVSEFYVIEIEHEKLTGTFYIFVPLEIEWSAENVNYVYIDRN